MERRTAQIKTKLMLLGRSGGVTVGGGMPKAPLGAGIEDGRKRSVKNGRDPRAAWEEPVFFLPSGDIGGTPER